MEDIHSFDLESLKPNPKVYKSAPKEKIVKMYNEGKKQAEIARELDLAPSTISSVISKVKTNHSNRLLFGYQKNIDDNIDKVLEMYYNGVNFRDIAVKIKSSRRLVEKFIKKHRKTHNLPCYHKKWKENHEKSNNLPT